MRTKIVFSLFIFLVSTSFLVINSMKVENNTALTSAQTQFTRPDSFYIGAIDAGWAYGDYDRLKELKLNIWHKYPRFYDGWWPIVQRDSLFDDSSVYYSNVQSKISNVNENDFDIVMDRAKITYITYGRFSDYKAANTLQQDSLYWFYRYYEHNNEVSSDYQDNEFGNGIWVRKCSTAVNDTGYVFKRLISNREQIKNSENRSLEVLQRKWHVIPRIRINPDYANNPNLDTTRICRIEVTDFYGNIVDSVTIKGENFKKSTGPDYDGNYREYYYYPTVYPNTFVRDTSFIIDSSGVLNPDNHSYGYDNCLVDYRIYWYGECDMWVDRIRVCNQVAFDLFDENMQNDRHRLYMDWIRWETSLGMTDSAGWRFACDEPEFCKMPVLKYINEKIMAQSGGKLGITPLVNYDNLRAHIPDYYLSNHFDSARLKTYLVDIGGFREYYFDIYPIVYNSNLPLQINGNSFSLNIRDGILGSSAPSIVDYEETINTIYDQPNYGWGVYQFSKDLKRGMELSRLTGIPFYPVLQAFLYHVPTTPPSGVREPTNEEIKAMTNIALAYGSKGIFYFAYHGFGEMLPNIEFCRGLVNENESYTLPYTNSPAKRLFNAYGQAKWDTICSINRKIL